MDKKIVLSRIRTELGLNLRQISNLVGVSISMIKRWEEGESQISSKHRPQVVRHYQISEADLDTFCSSIAVNKKKFNDIRKSESRTKDDD